MRNFCELNTQYTYRITSNRASKLLKILILIILTTDMDVFLQIMDSDFTTVTELFKNKARGRALLEIMRYFIFWSLYSAYFLFYLVLFLDNSKRKPAIGGWSWTNWSNFQFCRHHSFTIYESALPKIHAWSSADSCLRSAPRILMRDLMVCLFFLRYNFIIL